MISDRLPILSRILFALSCKSLFTSLYPVGKLPSLGREDRVNLLLRLEKDISNRYLCFGCTRLRPFNPHHKLGWRGQNHRRCGSKVHTIRRDVTMKRWPSWLCTKRRTKRFQLDRWRSSPRGPEVAFSEAHLVMNRHLYGKSHGLSIRTLEHHFSFERFINLDGNSKAIRDHFPLERHPPARRYLTRRLLKTLVESRLISPSADLVVPWRFTHDYRAKIIDDELFLARFHSIGGPSVSTSSFKKLLTCIGLPVCQHLIGSGSPDMPQIMRPIYQHHILHIDRFPAFLSCHRVGGSCRICFTDYTISIRGKEGVEDWHLELTNTYHRLGSCRTIDDQTWRSLVDLPSQPTRYTRYTRYIYGYGFGVGEIRKRWHGNDGEDIGENLEWGGFEPVDHSLSFGLLMYRTLL